MKKLELSRTEMKKFQHWLKSLPSQETSFMRHTYEREEIRQQKLIELYEKYLKS
jgi:hypothetical protein